MSKRMVAPDRNLTPLKPATTGATGDGPDIAHCRQQENASIAFTRGGQVRNRRPRATGRQHYSIKRLAERWDVSERTVRRLIDGGELRATMIGGQLRISDAVVETYEARHQR